MNVSESELNSLNEINYKSKIKLILLILAGLVIFIFSFLSFYPVGEKVKTIIKNSFQGQACNPDFSNIHFELLLPKLVIEDLSIPASCMNKSGKPLKLSYVNVNFNLISFLPFGLPFRIDADLSGQPISVYYVQGFNQQVIRIKDQRISMEKLAPLLGEDLKFGGSFTVDLNLSLSKRTIGHLEIKARSKDFQIPSQNIQGFTTPNLRINEFFMEAVTENPPRLNVEKILLGDVNSPMRANFRGKIDLQEGNFSFSPLDLKGEIAFSDSFRQSLPLIDMIFQTFTQKDGFYQIKLGGTLGSPKPMNP
jgi:type II secretion system protein N